MAKYNANGKYIPDNYDKSVYVGDEFAHTEKVDEEFRRRAQNAANTIKNQTAETKAKQSRAGEKKRADLARASEIEKILTDEFNSDLISRIVASFSEIGIDETLKRFENDFKTFKKYSDEFLSLQKDIGNIRTISYFDELLYRLARKYPKFILKLPAACFTYGAAISLPLSELSLDELHALETKLEKENVFSNPNFKSRYLKFFPNHVTELKDINEIGYALRLDPSCFKKFKVGGSLRGGFYQNVNVLDTLVKYAPEILKYLTEDELNLLANNMTSHVGVAIAKCPSVLEDLPSNFFAKFEPKFIFGLVTKTKIKADLEPYFARFPELQTYFASNKIKAKPVREPKYYPPVQAFDPTDF